MRLSGLVERPRTLVGMAIPLSTTLAAHVKASQRRPNILATAFAQRAGVDVLRWSRTYTGAEADAPHALAVVADPVNGDTIIRARNNAGSVEVSRGTSGAWTNVAAATSGTPVALARRHDDVAVLLYVDSASLSLRVRTSTDYGVSWSAASLIVTEASAISALALAPSVADNALCAFYVLASGTTLKRLRCSSAGAWAASGTNWTKSANVASLSGVAACHDGGDFDLIITGAEVTTTHPRVWAVRMGDGNFPANAWTGLQPIAEADALSTITYKAPAIAQVGLSFAGTFVQHEAGNVSYDRVYYSRPPASAGVSAIWREPAPHEAQGAHGLALAAPLSAGGNRVHASTPAGVWRSDALGHTVNLAGHILSLSYQLSPTSAHCILELDDHDGSWTDPDDALYSGATLQLQPGYASGAAGAGEYGVVQEFVIERVSHTFAPGKSTTTIEAGGGWEQLERWRAPQAWQVAAGVMTRDAIFQRVANRAGLEWLSGTGDEAPSSDWTTYKPAFAIAQGESGKTVLLRLLAVVPDYVGANGGTLTVLGIPDVATSPKWLFGFSPAELAGADAQLESYTTIEEAAQPANWARVQGPDRYADSVAYADLYQNGPAFRQVRNLDADSDAKALAWAANAARRDVVERPFGQLAAPFHPGVQLFDCITVETPLFGSHTRHAVGVAMKYSRGPRPAYSTAVTLGGA